MKEIFEAILWWLIWAIVHVVLSHFFRATRYVLSKVFIALVRIHIKFRQIQLYDVKKDILTLQ